MIHGRLPTRAHVQTNAPCDWTSQRGAMSAGTRPANKMELYPLAPTTATSSHALLAEAVADARAILEQLATVTRERNAYRLCFQQALHHSHHMHCENLRLRQQVERLRGELRGVRAQVRTSSNLPERVTRTRAA